MSEVGHPKSLDTFENLCARILNALSFRDLNIVFCTGRREYCERESGKIILKLEMCVSNLCSVPVPMEYGCMYVHYKQHIHLNCPQ